jgi:sarcosine oxidase subunit beta
MSSTADVVIIGGGCTGTSIALQLAKRKAGRIVLLEKHGIAMGATGKSSAIVRMHYTHEALARMALRARCVFEHFDDVIGGECGFRRLGFLALLGERDVDTVKANVAMHQRVGIDARALMPDDVKQLEPRITIAHIGAAAYEPDSGHADPYGTTTAYAAAAKRHGAELRIGVMVNTITRNTHSWYVLTNEGTIETRTLVVAAGYRTSELLAPLGVTIPLKPMRHTMAVVQRSSDFGALHPIISDRVFGSYYRPEGDELTLIGTTAADEGQVDIEVEIERAPTSAEEQRLAERFYRRFPNQGAATLRPGFTGVYDCSPDLQPMLGPVKGHEGLYVAAGFSGHGFKLSPVIGELMAEQICEGRTTLVDLTLFSPSRFAEGCPIKSPYPYSVQTLG